MALASLFMAWTTNPGAVPIGARPLPESRSTNDGEDEENDLAPLKTIAESAFSKVRGRGIRRCNKCNGNYKPPRAHHDSVTGRCIVKMDHFCPWVGNAVGALNHKFFFLFILYTLCTSFISLILLILRFIRCGFYTNDSEAEKEDTDDYNEVYLYKGCSDGRLYSPQVIVLLIVSITFLIFTCAMICEQADAIQNNTSKIARMKMSMGEGVEEFNRVTSEFNEMFGGTSPNVALHWFLPTSICFPNSTSMMKVMGYEYKDEWNGNIYEEANSTSDSSSSKATSLDLSLDISGCDADEGEFVAGGKNVPESEQDRMLPLDIHSGSSDDSKHRDNMKIA